MAASAGWCAGRALVFTCHSGNRSQAAAEGYLSKGFTKVYNQAGGILAWAREVDPNVGV